MRRLVLALVFPLLLLLAQQGALLHGLSHAYYSDRPLGAQVRQDDRLLDDSLCLTCQAFAQVANPVGSSTSHLALPPAAYLPSPDPAYRVVGADAPSPRSRGPPAPRA